MPAMCQVIRVFRSPRLPKKQTAGWLNPAAERAGKTGGLVFRIGNIHKAGKVAVDYKQAGVFVGLFIVFFPQID